MIPPLASRPGPVVTLDRLISHLLARPNSELARMNTHNLVGDLFDNAFMMELMLRILPAFRNVMGFRRYHGVYGLDDLEPLLAGLGPPPDDWYRARRLTAASAILRLRDYANIRPPRYMAEFADGPNWLYLGHMVRDFSRLPEPSLTPAQMSLGYGLVELLAQPRNGSILVGYLNAAGERLLILSAAHHPFQEPHVIEARRRYDAHTLDAV